VNQVQILFLSSLPSQQLRLNVGTELRRIESALDALGERFHVEERSSVRRTDMFRLLTTKRHIVHFSGHGNDDDHFLFETENGEAERVGTQAFVDWFDLLPEHLKPELVVFSACYSEPHAQAIADVVGCAVGVRATIRDSTSFDFATGFYGALGRGLNVAAAVRSGNATVSSRVASKDLPMIHFRKGLDPATVDFRAAPPIVDFPADLHMNRTRQLALFTEMLAHGRIRLLTITAPGNMGKTSLVEAMSKSVESGQCVDVDLGGGVVSPEEVLKGLSESLGVALTGPENVTSPVGRQAELEKATEEFFTAVRQKAMELGHRIALLLDSMEKVSGDLKTWLEKVFLPKLLTGGSDAVVCVVAGQVRPTIPFQTQLVRHEELRNLTPQDIRAVLQELGLDDSDTAVRLVLANGDGNPYLTRTNLGKALQKGVLM
jgi:hypothetical protein